jgi:hypothetical protein
MILRQAQDERAKWARLSESLAAKARVIAETRLSAHRNDPRRWRRAGWLWPLFARER